VANFDLRKNKSENKQNEGEAEIAVRRQVKKRSKENVIRMKARAKGRAKTKKSMKKKASRPQGHFPKSPCNGVKHGEKAKTTDRRTNVSCPVKDQSQRLTFAEQSTEGLRYHARPAILTRGIFNSSKLN